jgi:hypothetical protein
MPGPAQAEPEHLRRHDHAGAPVPERDQVLDQLSSAGRAVA